MILPSMLVVWLLASVVLFVFLQRQKDRRARLRLALQIGAVVGAARAIFACAGWYVVTHADIWLQFPAFFLALVALPEAAWDKSGLLYQGTSSADADFGLYARLGAMLVASSLAISIVVALAVDVLRWGRVWRRRWGSNPHSI